MAQFRLSEYFEFSGHAPLDLPLLFESLSSCFMAFTLENWDVFTGRILRSLEYYAKQGIASRQINLAILATMAPQLPVRNWANEELCSNAKWDRPEMEELMKTLSTAMELLSSSRRANNDAMRWTYEIYSRTKTIVEAISDCGMKQGRFELIAPPLRRGYCPCRNWSHQCRWFLTIASTYHRCWRRGGSRPSRSRCRKRVRAALLNAQICTMRRTLTRKQRQRQRQ